MGRPNVLVILSDQLSQRAVGAYGNPDAPTPHLDALASRGVRFENAYTTCPLCCPARASFWTGRLPHETGVLSNGREWTVEPVGSDVATVGSIFAAGGYRAVHFGKTHDAGSLRGFEVADRGREVVEGPAAFPYNDDTFGDVSVMRQCLEFLRRPPRGPWLMVADLVNPHNICGWIGANAGPEEQLAVAEPLPPLPGNFEVADWTALPRPVQYVCCAHRRLMQAAHWSERQYRQYLAAYYHYVGLLDRDVGRLLEALEATPEGRDTVVVFFADHGEGMAAHRMVTKHTTLHEEVTRVPWIVAGPGVTARGPAAGSPLVSLLDLMPTLCDVAGLEAPNDVAGVSVAPYLSGGAPARARESVVSEWHTEWGFTVEPGRMFRTARHKYIRYVEGDGEELYNLESDPGETRNLAADGAHVEELARHRALLERHLESTGDPFLSMGIRADARWRSHAPGYPNHEGPCAPTAAGVSAGAAGRT